LTKHSQQNETGKMKELEKDGGHNNHEMGNNGKGSSGEEHENLRRMEESGKHDQTKIILEKHVPKHGKIENTKSHHSHLHHNHKHGNLNHELEDEAAGATGNSNAITQKGAIEAGATGTWSDTHLENKEIQKSDKDAEMPSMHRLGEMAGSELKTRGANQAKGTSKSNENGKEGSKKEDHGIKQNHLDQGQIDQKVADESTADDEFWSSEDEKKEEEEEMKEEKSSNEPIEHKSGEEKKQKLAGLEEEEKPKETEAKQMESMQEGRSHPENSTADEKKKDADGEMKKKEAEEAEPPMSGDGEGPSLQNLVGRLSCIIINKP